MHETLRGIDVHRHWTYITPNKGFLKKTLGHISFVPSALLVSNRHVTVPHVTIGTSPTLFAAEAAARSGRKWRVPFVAEIRDLWPAVFVELGVLRNRQLIRMLEQWEMSLYRRAAAIVTVTEAFRRDLIKRGVPAQKVATIPNGADVDFWQPLSQETSRAELGLAPDRFTVLYIGAHGISQRLAAIVRAAERLRDEKIDFVFVGEGAEKDQLVALANDLKLPNVRFLEPVDKETVRRYYAAADVCLVPLRNIAIFDSFIPSKMFEIMSMARPIVASVRGEAAEILSRSGGALVVEPEQSDAIADAVRRLYESRDLRDELGQRGAEYVRAHYTRQQLAAKYLSLLRGVRR